MTTTDRRLRLSTGEALIGGVCTGIARAVESDPTVIRLVWVFAALLGGVGVLAYLVAWLVIPAEDGGHTLMPLVIRGVRVVLQVVLIVSFLLPLTVSTTPR